MPTKKNNPAKEDQKLSSIEDQLLECAKSHTPVLLYGKDTIGRKEVFFKIHELNGGVCESNEAFLYNDNFDPSGNPVLRNYEPSPSPEKERIRWTDKTCGYIDYGRTTGSKELKSSLNKRFARFVAYYGGALFVDRFYVDKNDPEDIKFAHLIADSIKHDVDKSGREPGCIKWLVIYVETSNSLPDYFREQFAEVCLEPEKQDKVIDTPQIKPRQDFVPFPTPAGTQWNDVTISFIDKENVKISIKNKVKAVTKSYAEMGFKGKSKRKEEGKTSVLWGVFREIAQLQGRLADYPSKEQNKTKKAISDLRKKLTSYFKIEGDPIPYKRGKGYESAFALKDESYSREYEDSIREQYKRHNRDDDTEGNYGLD